MTDPVEEVGEIRRILRVGGSRKRSRAYFIHAALYANAPPARPTPTSSGEAGPDCVIDITGTQSFASGGGPERSNDRDPRHTTVSTGDVIAPEAQRGKGKEEKRAPRALWGEDPAALKALETLGLDGTATLSDVKRKWRRLAQRLHPDKGGDAEVFIRARIAYETLIGRSRSAEG